MEQRFTHQDGIMLVVALIDLNSADGLDEHGRPMDEILKLEMLRID